LPKLQQTLTGSRRQTSPATAPTPDSPASPVSPATADTLRRYFERVVSPEGTARRAMVDGLSIAGKTGTAKRTTKTATAARKKAAARKTAPVPKAVSLGRPKVTGDEKLYLLFKDDYHARQICEFLRVETVRELEQYTPQQIVDRLTAPIVATVQRMRLTLAGLNRALADDREFAASHKEARPGKR
jgi:hypothetical protein